MSTLASVILEGVVGSLPAAGVPGRLYFATDTQETYRDNGTTWDNVSDSSAPSGSAGGDLGGTYPDPTVLQVNGGAIPVSAAFVGTNSSGQLVEATGGSGVTDVTASAPAASTGGTTPNITVAKATSSTTGVVKADGVSVAVDGAGNLTTVGAPPTGSASGDLSGSYPSPTVAKVNGAVVPASAAYLGSNSSRQIVSVSAPAVGNIVSLGTYASFAASPPSSPSTGDTFKCTDSPYEFMYTGSAWQAFHQGDPVGVPPSTGWTSENFTGAAADSTYGFLNLQYPGTNAATWRNYYRTAASSPYTINVKIRKINWASVTGTGTPDGFGVIFRDSSGKFIVFYPLFQVTNQGLAIEKWNSFSSFNSSYNTLGSGSASGQFAGASQFAERGELWLQMQDNGTNLIWSWGIDGKYWKQFDSQSRTAFLTSGPTQVGLGFRNGTGTEGMIVDVMGWG